jgi:hypothetical protein
MTVEELFRKLSYGELSNLTAAVDATGTIKKDRRNQVVHFINEGLLRLHTKFPLSQSDEIVNLTGVVVDQAFPELAINVLSLVTAYGQPLEIGSEAITGRIYVSKNRTLHIPATVTGEHQITYQLRHEELTRINDETDLEQEIELPDEFIEALTAYIGWKMHANILTAESVAAAAQHKSRFDELVSGDGHVGDTNLQTKFDQRGWT